MNLDAASVIVRCSTQRAAASEEFSENHSDLAAPASRRANQATRLRQRLTNYEVQLPAVTQVHRAG